MASVNMENIVNFGVIDCEADDSKDLCGYFQIDGTARHSLALITHLPAVPQIQLFRSKPEPVQLDPNDPNSIAFTKKPVPFQVRL